MGILLAFMFILNMLGLPIPLPSLGHFLLQGARESGTEGLSRGAPARSPT